MEDQNPKVIEIRDVCFANEYLNKEGEKRVRWTKIGVMFTKDNGGVNIKLDAMPMSTNQLVCFKKENRDAKPRTGSNLTDKDLSDLPF